MIDRIGECRAYSKVLHRMLMHVHIFPVGEPDRQGTPLEEAIRNHSAGDVLTDEVQVTDLLLQLTAYTNVICSLHGSSLRNIKRRVLLGLV